MRKTKKFCKYGLSLVTLLGLCMVSHSSHAKRLHRQHRPAIQANIGFAAQSSYEQTGVASWYGQGFHGKKTASGERFNMGALTAAHRTLPLGTIVRVTNLRNNKSVFVRVNDRGPYHGGRILDVSQAAANELGFLGQGSTRIKLETTDQRASLIAKSKESIVSDSANSSNSLELLFPRISLSANTTDTAVQNDPIMPTLPANSTRVMPRYALRLASFTGQKPAEVFQRMIQKKLGKTSTLRIQSEGKWFHLDVLSDAQDLRVVQANAAQITRKTELIPIILNLEQAEDIAALCIGTAVGLTETAPASGLGNITAEKIALDKAVIQPPLPEKIEVVTQNPFAKTAQLIEESAPSLPISPASTVQNSEQSNSVFIQANPMRQMSPIIEAQSGVDMTIEKPKQ